MGKKGKKEKGRAAEKAAQKLMKKEKKTSDMADLEAMIADFQEADRKKTTFYEEKCQHPSPRTNLSVCVHPEKDELILFGGEYFNGQKTLVYNDLFVYNIKRDEWSKHFVPNPPPPRCAHQAVTYAKDGGQMWLFGGEFSSPNNTQFYHYRDLWLLQLKEHRWQQITAAGGPSQRSGHRMCSYNRNLFVFGGFHESYKDFVYFNDCYLFSLTDYCWTKLSPTGSGPSPRSACQLCVSSNAIFVVGGYSKTKVKKDIEKGTAHSDIHLLTEEPGAKWKWSRVKDSGQKPWPRSGFSLVQTTPSRAVLFGGVSDEDLEENLDSVFHNSLFCFDSVAHRWFPLDIRQPKAAAGAGESSKSSYVLPCARMNGLCVVKRGTMFLYGGSVEDRDKQITLNDLWCIDVKKVDGWKQLVESDDTRTDWLEQASDDDDDELSGDSDDDDDGRDNMEWMGPVGLDHPPVRGADTLASYWFRTREHWLQVACDDADEAQPADVTASRAERHASAFFNHAASSAT